MAEVASADVTLIPRMTGVTALVQRATAEAGQAGGAKLGSGISAGIAIGVGSAIAGTAIKAVGAIGNLAIGSGIARALNIEQATAKLSGLGHSAEAVKGIMTNAMAAVKGTAYTMGDAASVAASAVAAGVQPGKDLERTLGLVGDAATIAGTGMGEMGAVFNKVAANNKLQMDSVNQLQDRGIPVLQLVAEQMGVTQGEAAKMASEGKVSFDIFRDAIESGMGGAALKSGNTFTGSLANVKAAIAKVGESFATPILQNLTGVFQDSSKIINGFVDSSKGAAEKFGEAFSSGTAKVKDVLGGMFGDIVPRIKDVATEFFELAAKVKDLIAPITDLAGAAVIGALKLAWEGVMKAFDLAKETLKTIKDNLTGVSAAVAGLGAAFLVLKLSSFVSECGSVSMALLTMVTNLERSTLALKLQAIATKIAAAGQAILNLVMNANPIMRVVSIIMGLVAVFIVLWNKSEAFRNFFIAIWEGIKAALSAVASFFVNFGTSIMNAISSAFTWIWITITSIWTNISTAVSTGITTVINFVCELPGKIMSGLASLGSMLLNLFTDMWNGAKNAVTNGISAVIEFVTGLPGKIADALSGLFNLGVNALQGFIDGCISVAGKIKDAVLAPIRGAINGVKSFLGIASPSKLLASIGRNTGAGFAAGLAATNTLVANTADKLAAKAIPTLNTVFEPAQFTMTRPAYVNDATSVNGGRGGDTIVFEPGALSISLQDLTQLQTLEDFIQMLRVRMRMG